MWYDHLCAWGASRVFHSHTGPNHGRIASIPPEPREPPTQCAVPQCGSPKGGYESAPGRPGTSARGEGAEAFQFVHKSQVELLRLAVVIRLLPLRLPEHFPQNRPSRLRGEEGVVERRVVSGRAELKEQVVGGEGGGGFGARRVRGRGGPQEEGVRALHQPPVFGLLRDAGAPPNLRSSRGRRSSARIQPSVPAARVIHRGRNPVLQQEAHQA